MTEGLETYGPDSLIGKMLSTMMGSTETTFYVLAVYFGSVGIRRSRHAVPACLIGDFAGLAAAVVICSLVF
jgi:spore maturation protein B